MTLLIRRLVVVAGLLTVLPGVPPAAFADRQNLGDLADRHREWLLEVALLISPQEEQAFLDLEADYQRDGFVERFWEARDPYPVTERNEMRDLWYGRLDYAKEEFGNWTEDRARVLLLNGEPALREEVATCQLVLHPVEAWVYPRSERAGREVKLLFYQAWGLPPFRLWTPRDGYLELFSEPRRILEQRCERGGVGTGPISRFPKRDGEDPDDISFECAMFLLADVCGLDRGALIQDVIYDLEMEEHAGGNVETLFARLQSRPDPEQEEWLATFAAHSTDLAPDAELLAAESEFRFPGRRQSRIVVETVLRVPRDQATPADLGAHSSFDFVLTGEILREGELFESFRYSFGFPEADAPETLPLVFRRHLRPGDYRMVLKLEEIHGQRFFRLDTPLTVPSEPVPSDEPESAWMDEARYSLGGTPDRPPVELQTQARGVLVGGVRFDAVPRDDSVASVEFLLDGTTILTRNRPPFTVELDLGDYPRPRVLRAVARDSGGREIGSDELRINAGENRFGVRIVEPRSGRSLAGPVSLRVEVVTPDDAPLDRLEVYRGEILVATLHQPPFELPLQIPDGPSYLRAVGYLRDGNATEDLVLLNVEGALEEVDVELVEIHATVLDPEGRPVRDLRPEETSVREDGEPQRIVRFEPVSEQPVHLAVVVDASASMVDHLPAVRKAAAGFLEAFLTPRDRAALVVFHDKPRLLETLTSDVSALAEEIAGFSAEGNTALYDSIVFALHHLTGIRGRKALLVLTDGKDETSRFDFDQTLAYARSAGTTIYSIGIGTDVLTRRHLAQLADESGGRSFRVDGSSGLATIYDTIAGELRSGYLVVYQSSRTDGDRSFRRVEVDVTRPGHEVRAMRGYYP